MPLPLRYADEVPELTKIWSASGYFTAQTSIWLAECQAMAELSGFPNADDLELIKTALRLSDGDLTELSRAEGHETNRLLRLVQSRLPARLRSEVPELTKIWSASGYFTAQTSIWLAECQAMAELSGFPNADDLELIKTALRLSDGDLTELSRAEGHETNRLLRLVQSRLPARL